MTHALEALEVGGAITRACNRGMMCDNVHLEMPSFELGVFYIISYLPLISSLMR